MLQEIDKYKWDIVCALFAILLGATLTYHFMSSRNEVNLLKADEKHKTELLQNIKHHQDTLLTLSKKILDLTKDKINDSLKIEQLINLRISSDAVSKQNIVKINKLTTDEKVQYILDRYHIPSNSLPK